MALRAAFSRDDIGNAYGRTYSRMRRSFRRGYDRPVGMRQICLVRRPASGRPPVRQTRRMQTEIGHAGNCSVPRSCRTRDRAPARGRTKDIRLQVRRRVLSTRSRITIRLANGGADGGRNASSKPGSSQASKPGSNASSKPVRAQAPSRARSLKRSRFQRRIQARLRNGFQAAGPSAGRAAGEAG